MTITYKIWGDEITEKVIDELSETDLEGRTVLGSAFGIDKLHCLSIASRRCKNFSERVVGYRKIEPPEDMKGNYAVGIEFYE